MAVTSSPAEAVVVPAGDGRADVVHRFVPSASEFLRKQPRSLLLGAAIALVTIIGLIDFATGYELSLVIFYAIPIIFSVWYLDRNSAILVSLLAALAWWWADVAAGHVYSEPWLRGWNTVTHLIFFIFVVVGGSALKSQRDASIARVELLERTQRLEQEIIGISETERQRIGRDLHDGICQYLAAIGYAASSLRRDLEKRGAPESAAAEEIAGLLKEAVVQTRDLARGLSPVERDENGLQCALEELAASTTRLLGIHCSFEGADSVKVHDNARAVHLFRIAQEALSNATKHGEAKNILIRLEQKKGMMVLEVADDGIGFTAKGTGNGMGLGILQYRARVIGGKLEIRANQPKGTVVSCVVPEET